MSVAINGTDGITYNDGSLQPSAPVGRNLIINGNMAIAQRATSVTGITGTGYDTVDRWRTDVATAGTWTQTQDTDVPTGQGFANSVKMDCTTADASLAANDRIFLGQRIEGFNVQSLAKGTANAKSTTLSFWVKSNKTGTYIAELFDSPNSRQISAAYTISVADTWEKKTITYAGDTSGVLANDNDIGLMVQFWLAAGSTYTSGTLNTSWAANTNANRAVGQVNLADSTSNYINITGVQLEANTTATPFEYLQYGQQLALCQRYYWRWTDVHSLVNAVAYTTTAFYGVLSFNTTMRAAPTFAVSSASHFNIFNSATAVAASAFTAAKITENSARLNFTASSARTQGQAGWVEIITGAGKYIESDAEL